MKQSMWRQNIQRKSINVQLAWSKSNSIVSLSMESGAVSQVSRSVGQLPAQSQSQPLLLLLQFVAGSTLYTVQQRDNEIFIIITHSTTTGFCFVICHSHSLRHTQQRQQHTPQQQRTVATCSEKKDISYIQQFIYMQPTKCSAWNKKEKTKKENKK